MVFSFTSKDAFKTLTFAIKEALGKSVKVSDIRNAAARSEGFNSATEYMDALDKKQPPQSTINLPKEFVELFVLASQKLTNPYCFIHVDAEVHIISLNDKKENERFRGSQMLRTDLSLDGEPCLLAKYIVAMNQKLGYSSVDDLIQNGFERYIDVVALGLKPSSECLTIENDPFQNPELIDILVNQDYGTAVYLQDLVAHLWNSEWQCNLPRLLNNADKKHYKYAQEIIEHYNIYGEEAASFREVASRVVSNKICNLAYGKGWSMAEEKAARHGHVNVSHQEFTAWKKQLPRKIDEGEITDADFSLRSSNALSAFKRGVEAYEEAISIDNEWVK